MIKTLRITGVAAVAFAGLVLASVLGPVSLIHLDGKNDQRISRVQSSPGAVERFQELHGDRNAPSQDTKPPLVRQAELFKDIIDPKPMIQEKPVARAETPVRVTPGPGPRAPVTPKFTLLGTSRSASNPNASFAYIRLPDNTYQWVQSGSEIGHLTIKEVREGSLLCWDGQRESEVSMEPVADRVSLMTADEAAISPTETPIPQAVPVKISESPAVVPQGMPQPVPAAMRSGASKMTEEEQRAVSELVEKYRKMQSSSGDANAATAADRLALANKLMSELRSSRISPQETRKLENLGDQVVQDNERAREEPNR
jgi:hypothetical protein